MSDQNSQHSIRRKIKIKNKLRPRKVVNLSQFKEKIFKEDVN
jgi:hypothetical protein